jgi:hypothetical protein
VTPSVHPPTLPNPVAGIELDAAKVGAGGTGVGADEPDDLLGFLGFDVGFGSSVDGTGVLVGEMGVLVGGAGVLVGDSCVLVGCTGGSVSWGSLVGVGRGGSVSWTGAACTNEFPPDASVLIPPANRARIATSTTVCFIIMTLSCATAVVRAS